MTHYKPDKWVLISTYFKEEKTSEMKVFATWSGGYLDGDSWKLNSGIAKVEKDGEYYLFHGNSGSVYECHENMYGTNSYGAMMLSKFEESASYNDNVSIIILPEEKAFKYINGVLDV